MFESCRNTSRAILCLAVCVCDVINKAAMQGTVKGGRRQGRQKKKWEDNIREWTDMEFIKSQKAVENREKWRKLVVKPSVVLPVSNPFH